MAAEAVAWMEKNKDRPFYLNYWMFSVHAPFDAKKSLIEKHRARVNPADPQRSPTYAAMIESMDDAIGTLLDALDRLQIADHTIIIFTSDNGGNMYNEVDGTTPTSNAPLRGGKATMFEGGTRVPCVVVWPGVTAAGSRSDAIIQSEDYYPTLLDGLGLQAAPGQRFDGVSILPALQAANSPATPSSSTSRTIPVCPTGCRPPSLCIAATGSSSASSTAAKTARIAICFSTCARISARRTTWPRRNRSWSSELDCAHQPISRRDEGRRAGAQSCLRPGQVSPRTRRQAEAQRSPAKTAAKAAKPTAKDDGDPALQGWKARSCTATVTNGIVTVRDLSDASFLGFAAGKHSGASTVKLRIKAGGGEFAPRLASRRCAGPSAFRPFTLPGWRLAGDHDRCSRYRAARHRPHLLACTSRARRDRLDRDHIQERRQTHTHRVLAAAELP